MLLWEFILELLQDENAMDLISWTNYDGEFQFHQPETVARLWGLRKNRKNMTYKKMYRGIRYYYKMVILKLLTTSSSDHHFSIYGGYHEMPQKACER